MLPCFPVPNLCKPLALPSFICASLVHIFHSKAVTTTPKLSLTSPKTSEHMGAFPSFRTILKASLQDLCRFRFFFGRRNLKHKNIISQLKKIQTLTSVGQARRGGNPPRHRTSRASPHPRHRRSEAPTKRRQMPVTQHRRAMTSHSPSLFSSQNNIGSDLARAQAKASDEAPRFFRPPALHFRRQHHQTRLVDETPMLCQWPIERL